MLSNAYFIAEFEKAFQTLRSVLRSFRSRSRIWMVRYVYIQFNQSSVPLLYAIRGEWFVMFTSPSGLLSQLSSSFSVGLMRVPAGHHTFPLLVKEPVLHCRQRGENFQKYLLWGPASLSEHEASHLYWQARPQHAFSTHASLAVTGTQVVYGKRQPHPRPGTTLISVWQRTSLRLAFREL